MYIKERNGKFRYFQDYKDPLTEKRKTVSCTLNSKSRAAQKQARIILTERIEKALEKSTLFPVQKTIRLGNAVDEWVKFYKKIVKPSTFNGLKNVGAKKIKQFFGENTLLNKITPKYIENVVDRMQYDSGYKLSTVKTLYSYIRVFFTWSTKKGYFEHNPINDVSISWKKNTEPRKIENKFLENDELEAVLSYAYKHAKRVAPLIEWLYLTGMRLGEAAALSFDDIKWTNGVYIASVTGTLNYLGVPASERKKSLSPKTQGSFRNIELSNRAVEIINYQKTIEHRTDFIFENRFGYAFVPENVNKSLQIIQRELNLNKKLTSHIFRHTHISKLAELGVPLYVIQQRVGHTSKVTEEIYLHVTKKAKRKMIDKLDEL